MYVRHFKQLSVIVTVVLLIVSMTGCNIRQELRRATCQHQWQKSTCLAPRTCTLCGLTEGKVRAHEYANTACNAAQPCIYCGTMDGIEYTHEWRNNCKICKHCGYDARPADDRFMDKLVLGLESRFALNPPDPTPEDEEYWYGPKPLTREDWQARFEAEYAQVVPFLEEEFQDPELGALAKSYAECIVQSMDALDTFGTEQWDDLYPNHIYQVQTETLFHIHQLRPFTVKEEYDKFLQEMLINGEAMKMVNELIDEVMFLYVDTNGNQKKYETTLTNTTSLDFKYFTFDVELLNADGKRIHSETITKNHWNSGDSHRFTIYTDKEFQVMRIYAATWQLQD